MHDLAELLGAVAWPVVALLALQVAEATRRKHVQYRVVLAFIELLKRRFVQPGKEGHIIAVLDRFKNVDDPPLQRLIKQTEPLLATLFV